MNSFLHPIDEVRFDAYRPGDVPEALRVARALAEERYAAVSGFRAEQRTFENTVLGLTRAAEQLDHLVTLVQHLAGVLPEWAEADAAATSTQSDLRNDVSLSRPLYEALLVVRESPDRVLLPHEQRLLTMLIDEYERNGVALDDAQQAELRTVRSRISELQVTFAGNVTDAVKSAGLALGSGDELSGMPSSFVDRCREAAVTRGLSGWWIAYDAPTYVDVMTACSHAPTRRRLYDVHVSLAGKVNAGVAIEILALRRRQARLLGFDNFADLATVGRMAGSSGRVAQFLSELTERYRPAHERDHVELRTFARALEGDPMLELDAADVDTPVNLYYAARLQESRIGVDARSVREYLPLPAVLEAAFGVFSALYGVRFAAVDKPGWHRDVSAYDVHDEHGRHRATMYADWAARPGKRLGAWMGSLYRPPRGCADNGKPAIGHVVFNLAPPEPGEPTLCTPRDAQTVLHELGHFMHMALSDTTLPEQTAATVARDFLEAPSLIMENWFWEPEVLRRMARHHRTGEALPPHIARALTGQRTFRTAAAAMRQFAFATLDLEMHRDFEGDDLYAFARQVKQRFLPAGVAVSEKDVWPASLSHVFHMFDGAYAAGLYSYKWAEVLEAALFERFAQEGVLNREVGEAYAAAVLSRGSEVPPDELVHTFLGGPPSPEPMLRRDGLLTAESLPAAP